MTAAARSKGKTGRPWRRARAYVLRHQTICHLCGQPVDKTLTWPNPRSASVDHVIPLEAGGPPLALTNLRLAHLTCNSSKKNNTTIAKTQTARQW
jgi:5-methylcytosine-specific restriction endonuclease McrA